MEICVPVKRPERPLCERAQLVETNRRYWTTLGVILRNTNPCPLRFKTGSIIGLPTRLHWLVSELQGSFCLYLPSAGIISMPLHTNIFMWVLKIKLRFSCLHSGIRHYWPFSPQSPAEMSRDEWVEVTDLEKGGESVYSQNSITSRYGREIMVNTMKVFTYESPCAWSHKIRWGQGTLRS